MADNKDKKVLNVPHLRFPEFSGEWEKHTIGELAIKVGSGVTPKGGETVYKKEGHPFVRSQNVGLGATMNSHTMMHFVPTVALLLCQSTCLKARRCFNRIASSPYLPTCCQREPTAGHCAERGKWTRAISSVCWR